MNQRDQVTARLKPIHREALERIKEAIKRECPDGDIKANDSQATLLAIGLAGKRASDISIHISASFSTDEDRDD